MRLFYALFLSALLNHQTTFAEPETFRGFKVGENVRIEAVKIEGAKQGWWYIGTIENIGSVPYNFVRIRVTREGEVNFDPALRAVIPPRSQSFKDENVLQILSE